MEPSPDRKLRIQFTKALRKGYVKNARLDPSRVSESPFRMEDGELVIADVAARTGLHYLFTDRRILIDNKGVAELFRYESVIRAHWIQKDKRWDSPQTSIAAAKREHYDRIEVELTNGVAVLEGLDQAYVPVLSFLQWL